MAILVNSGRAAAAAAVKAQPIHMAWSSGDPSWDEAPVPELATAETLLNELGRRRASQVLFCTPDPQGELVVPTGRFTASTAPTKHLYMRFAFDFVDAPASTFNDYHHPRGQSAISLAALTSGFKIRIVAVTLSMLKPFQLM